MAKADTALADTFQSLISAGHRLPDIANYTCEQLLLFIDAVAREEGRHRTSKLNDMAIATQGDSKQIARAAEKLTNAYNLNG